MDWGKPNEEMFTAWTKAQTKMWEVFSESVSGFGKSPGEKTWAQAIAAGEELIKNSLAAQTEWMKGWAENFNAMDGMPAQAAEALEQFQMMMGGWADTQEKLWGAWFDMLKKFETSQFTSTWGSIPKDPFQVWQENTKQIMDMQMNWARAWLDQFNPNMKD